MFRDTFIKLTILTCAVSVNLSAYAQRKKKQAEEKVPVYNYTIDEPIDNFGRKPQVYRTVILPEFVKLTPYYIKDTLISYECFNRSNQKLIKDTITNPASISYISAIKKYTDPDNSYRERDGSDKPIPTEKIFLRYDRLGNDKWIFIDYAKFSPVTMQEYPGDITRTDTISVPDPMKHEDLNIVYKMYKVTPIGK